MANIRYFKPGRPRKNTARQPKSANTASLPAPANNSSQPASTGVTSTRVASPLSQPPITNTYYGTGAQIVNRVAEEALKSINARNKAPLRQNVRDFLDFQYTLE
jgi:hypothetical protein